MESKRTGYLNNARHCRDMADQARNADIREGYLALAQRWLHMADQWLETRENIIHGDFEQKTPGNSNRRTG